MHCSLHLKPSSIVLPFKIASRTTRGAEFFYLRQGGFQACHRETHVCQLQGCAIHLSTPFLPRNSDLVGATAMLNC